MKDYLVRASCYNDTVRIFAARTTNLVEEARKRHDLWPSVTAGLGRTLTVAAIMGSMYKNNEELSIRIDGNGQAGVIIVETNTIGEVRGYAQNPHVDFRYNNGKINVAMAVGQDGFIHVTKDLKMKEIMTSSSPLQTGEIAEDFTYYFTVSEQIPSAVSLGVLVHNDKHVISAGGYVLQIMPGCNEETITKIESLLKEIKPASTLIGEGSTPEDIINILSGSDYKNLGNLNLSFKCNCSKERFERGLISLGKEEIRKIIKEEENGIETKCHFCNEIYNFNKEELNNLI